MSFAFDLIIDSSQNSLPPPCDYFLKYTIVAGEFYFYKFAKIIGI